VVTKANGSASPAHAGFLGGIFNAAESLTTNLSLMRQDLVRLLNPDPRRNIGEECGYPDAITPQIYRQFYDRMGSARKVVHILPEESWKMDPEVYETEDGDNTEFEDAVKKLDSRLNLFAFLERIDIISGIGRFGVLLLGFDDGKELREPVEGMEEEIKRSLLEGEPPKGVAQLSLMYIRALDESSVTVDRREHDKNNPRYGQPIQYTMTLKEPGMSGGGQVTESSQTLVVHWTRIIHVADNRLESEVVGTPRMQPVYDRLYDKVKIYGASGEGYWRGAFPGISFETMPGLGANNVIMDETKLKRQLRDYANGLQRYLAIVGVTAKSLAPQVVDPTKQLEAVDMEICITLGIPTRIWRGSERGELSSSQDKQSWNERLKRRQEKYLTPYIVRVTFDRLICAGVLPEPSEYFVSWPDLNTVTDLEKADVALKRTQAMAAYVAGDVQVICPPTEYLTLVLEMDPEEVTQIETALEEHQQVMDDQQLHDAEMQAEVDKATGNDPQTKMKIAQANKPPPGQPGKPPFGGGN
jgi:hypothetical protein